MKEDSELLIGRVTEAVKHEIKIQEGEFLDALLSSLTASVVLRVMSSIVKGTGRRVMRAVRGYFNNMDKHF